MHEYDIERNLSWHKPSPAQNDTLDILREAAKDFDRTLQSECKTSPELTLAYRKVEEALFFAMASVVRP